MNSMDRNYVQGHAVVRFDGLRLSRESVLGWIGAPADKPLLGDEPKDGERISAALRRDFGSPSELMNEPRDEYGLAGAREAGDAEPQA